jgi:Family of unknown function (DUF5941)
VTAGQPAEPASAAAGRLAGPASAAAHRLAELGDGVSEYTVYAGLALGGYAAHRAGMWQLATAAMIVLTGRKMIAACGGVAPGGSGIARILGVLGLPAGGRMLLIAVVAPVWGDRAALLFLLEWGIIAIGYALTGPRHPRRPESLAACRDDGRIAARIGQLVRGQLVPLPPALVGLAATALLVLLGLRALPGVLVLTPPVVLLLGAPGSGHPHDGRLDWLVPAVLQAAQLLYIAALGFSFGVPGAVTFALCALIALHYTTIAGRGWLTAGPEPPSARPRLGWEGRVLVAGVGAMLGIATVAYLALAGYVGVLIWLKVMASYRAEPAPSAPVRAGARPVAAAVRR